MPATPHHQTATLTPLRRRRRGQLFLAALDLIERQGFDDTSIDEIAEHAGISRRSFFNYFATKEALLVHLHRDVTRQVEGALDEAREFPPLEAVRHALLRFGAALETRPRVVEALLARVFSSAALRVQDARDSAALVPKLEDQLAAASRAGTLAAAVDPAEAAGFLLSTVTGTLTHWAMQPRPSAAALRASLAGRLDWAIRGLSASEASHV